MRRAMWLLAGLTVTTVVTARLPLSVRLGYVLGKDDSFADSLVLSAAERINARSDLLNYTGLSAFPLHTDSTFLSAHRETCRMLEHRVTGLVSSLGPTDAVVSSISAAYHVPHVSTRAVSPAELWQNPYTVYLAPTKRDITQAVIHTVLGLQVEKVAVVSHAASGVLEVTMLLEALQLNNIHVLNIDLAQRDIRPDLVKIRTRKFHTCIVDVGDHLVMNFIQQAMQSGVAQPEFNFIFTTLDFALLDLDLVQETGAGFIGFSAIDPTKIEDGGLVRHEAALMEDAMALLSRAIEIFSESLDDELDAPAVTCNKREEVYSGGEGLLDSIYKVEMSGLTGQLSLERQARKHLHLHMLMLTAPNTSHQPWHNRRVIATWERIGEMSHLKGNIKQEVAAEDSETEATVPKDAQIFIIARRLGNTSATSEALPDTEAVSLLQQLATDEANEERRQLEMLVLALNRQGHVVRILDVDAVTDDIPFEKLVETGLLDSDAVGRGRDRALSAPYHYLTLYNLNPKTLSDEKTGLNRNSVMLMAVLVLLSWSVCWLSLSLTSRLSLTCEPLSMSDSLWLTTATFLLKPTDKEINCAWSRLILLSWWVLSMVSLLTCWPLLTATESYQKAGDLSSGSSGNWSENYAPDTGSSVTPEAGLLLTSEALLGYSLIEESSEVVAVGHLPLRLGLAKGSTLLEIINNELRQLNFNRKYSTKLAPQTENSSVNLDIVYYCCAGVMLTCFLSSLLSLTSVLLRSTRTNNSGSSTWRLFTSELKSALHRGSLPHSYSLAATGEPRAGPPLLSVSPLSWQSSGHPAASVARSRSRADRSGVDERSELKSVTGPEEEMTVEVRNTVTDQLILARAHQDRVENSRL